MRTATVTSLLLFSLLALGKVSAQGPATQPTTQAPGGGPTTQPTTQAPGGGPTTQASAGGPTTQAPGGGGGGGGGPTTQAPGGGGGATTSAPGIGGSCSTSGSTCTSGVCDPLASQCQLRDGDDCSTVKVCVTGAVCNGTTNTCNCAGKYSASGTVTGTCEASQGEAGGPCKTGNTCDDTNAQCSGTICICKTGFSVKVADATCQPSGAVKPAVSIMCVAILTFLSTLL